LKGSSWKLLELTTVSRYLAYVNAIMNVLYKTIDDECGHGMGDTIQLKDMANLHVLSHCLLLVFLLSLS